MSQLAEQSISNPTTESTLVTKSIQEFVTERNIASIAQEVRVNKNGYPFVTFIDGDNKAENVYFSKNASASVEAGQPIQKGFFNELYIATVTNAQGEERIKLCTGGGNRVSVMDVL